MSRQFLVIHSYGNYNGSFFASEKRISLSVCIVGKVVKYMDFGGFRKIYLIPNYFILLACYAI